VGDKEEEMKALMTMFMEIMGAGVSVYSTTITTNHHHHNNDSDTSTNSSNSIINHPCGGNTNPNQTPSPTSSELHGSKRDEEFTMPLATATAAVLLPQNPPPPREVLQPANAAAVAMELTRQLLPS
jgi:hypothetical protein